MTSSRALGVLLLLAASAPAAVIRGRVVDAGTGRMIPCTVAIRTPAGAVITESPNFRDGFRSSGTFEKEVPAGSVSVTVSRGFDYAAARQDLMLAGSERKELEFQLRRRTPLLHEGWVCGDNHVHMIHGERRILVDFPDVALAARAEALDYVSLAQAWNLPEATPEALEAACRRVRTDDFLLTWNLEAPKNYWRGDVSHCVGHGWTVGMRGRTRDGRNAVAELLDMSAWDYESDKTPVPNFEIQAFIHSLGGIVACTHPHRWWWGNWGGQGGYPVEEKKFVSNMAAELPFDTIAGPTYDAIDIMMQPREREVNQKAQDLWFLLLNKGYRIAATTSSDTTFDNPGGGVPGKVRVYTRIDRTLTMDRLAQAMKAGRNFVTSGPLLTLVIGDHQIGDVVKLQGPVKLKAVLRAWASGRIGEKLARVEVLRNGAVIRTFTPDNPELSTGFDIEESQTAWYIARAYGAADDQVAITNPIYFETPDYQAPRPEPARVTASVHDAAGRPLAGEFDVVQMDGRTPAVVSSSRFQAGRFTATVPAAARLRVRSDGYAAQMRSVYMDSPRLLNLTLNMTPGQLSDWRTFEQARSLLKDVRLDFVLRPAAAGR